MMNDIIQRILVHDFAVLLSLWVAEIDEEMSQIKYLYFIHKVELFLIHFHIHSDFEPGALESALKAGNFLFCFKVTFLNNAILGFFLPLN